MLTNNERKTIERLPNSVGRACRSFTGGSAF